MAELRGSVTYGLRGGVGLGEPFCFCEPSHQVTWRVLGLQECIQCLHLHWSQCFYDSWISAVDPNLFFFFW